MPEMTVNQIHSLGFWMSLDLSDTEGDRDIQTDHQIWSRPTRLQALQEQEALVELGSSTLGCQKALYSVKPT